MTWYDLSPMRPDDYAKTQARRWTEAVTCRAAFDEGMRDAAREGETFRAQGYQA
jgi:hypothetical protein